MDKYKAVLFFGVLIIGAIVFFAFDQPIKKPKDGNVEAVIEDVESEIFIDPEEEMKIVVVNSNLSATKTEIINIKGLEEKQVIEKILHVFFDTRYFKDHNLNPGDVLISTRIWNETLEINLAEEILDIQVNEKEKERRIIKALTNSLIQVSDKYTDIIFLINGERNPAIFGAYDTKNPFTYFNEELQKPRK